MKLLGLAELFESLRTKRPTSMSWGINKMRKIIGSILLTLLLAGCIVTPPVITDVYRDGDELVFHKASIQVNTITYQVNERDGRDIRIQIK